MATKNFNRGFFVFVIAIAMMAFSSAPASAVMQATGPINTNNGFPTWYQDTAQIALELQTVDDAGTPLTGTFGIASDIIPASPFSQQIRFGPESFWWSAEAFIGSPVATDADFTTGRIILVLAQEAAFTGDAAADVVDGNQQAFSRIRVRIDNPPALGTYTITHPYGTETLEAVEGATPGTIARIFFTDDIGCLIVPGLINRCSDLNTLTANPTDTFFDLAGAASTSRVGPYLRWTTFNVNPALSDPLLVNPANNRTHVGRADIEHAVTGSPTGNNFFRIQGPAGADFFPNTPGIQNVIETTLFGVSGKIAAGPTVINVTSSNASVAYGIGKVLHINITFNMPAIVTGTPLLTLETGATDRTASFISGSGTNTLVFAYTVQAGDTSADLGYTSMTALALNGGTINDAVLTTTPAILNLPLPGASGSLGFNKNIVIDGVAPTGAITSNANVAGALKIGDTITFTLMPSTPEPGATVAGSYNGVALTWSTADAGAHYTGTYTVANGNPDQVTSLQISGVIIADAAGNPSAPIAGADVAKTIDANAPAVASVTALNADGIYPIGAPITVSVVFNDTVTVNGFPTIALATGMIGGVPNRTATFVAGSGTNRLNFTFTVQSGDGSADLDYTSMTALALNGSTVTDAAGNAAVLTLPAPGAAGSLSVNKNLVIDGVGPALTGSNPVNNARVQTLGAITFTMQQPVGVDTAATTITATRDGAALTEGVNFTRANGANGQTATITLTITASTDGTYAFSVTPRSVSGLIGSLSTVTVTDDSVAPTVLSVSAATTDGAYKAGQNIIIAATFSEAVAVTGTPTLALETGATDRAAAFTSGSGTDTLTFTYTVQAGDTSADLDYLASNSLVLNLGSINDIAGNAGVLTLQTPGAAGSLGFNKNIVIDTRIPLLVSSPTASPTSDAATVTWTSDESTLSRVFYGTTNATTSNATNTALSTSNSVTLTGLTASTLYFYNVSSCDAANNCNTSSQFNFTTAAAPAPAPSGGGGGGSASSSVSSVGGGASGGLSVSSDSEGSQVLGQISEGARAVFEFRKPENFSVYQVVAVAGSQSVNPSVVVKENKAPAQTLSATVYKYIDITRTNMEVMTSAKIRFKVSNEWLAANNLGSSDVRLYHLEADGWKVLPTSFNGDDGKMSSFEAETSSFSTFAVAGTPQPTLTTTTIPETVVEVEQPVITTTTTTLPREAAITGQATAAPSIQPVLIVLLVAAMGAAAFGLKKIKL